MEKAGIGLKVEQEAHEEDTNRHGKLKIFLGYAAGVGKTHAMLEAAQRMKGGGVDVVVGYVEPHTRPETLCLLEGLEALPAMKLFSGGYPLREFDLDGALKRHPQLLVVDALAHNNASGCRHLKRYQDVEELLRAGIDVYTTINVQNLESLNDVVVSITGKVVSERVPDRVFDAADQVEVVDIEPTELLERLRAEPNNLLHSTSSVTSENLAALREIALRRTADRLRHIPIHTAESRAKAGEHILICLSGSPSNGKVIRTAARMVEAFHGDFTALFVETSAFSQMGEDAHLQLRENIHLAEQLGARVATVYGDNPAIQIAEYARVSGVSKIVMGRCVQQKRILRRTKSLIDRLGTLAPDLDIYIIPDRRAVPALERRLIYDAFSCKDFGKMLGILTVCTGIGYLITKLGCTDANVSMVYILGVLCVAATTSGHGYSLLSSALSVLVFNFFFTHPYFSLSCDPSYVATFGVMFLVAFLTSSLTTRVKRQAIESAQKAYRTEVLLETSQRLQKAEGAATIRAVTAAQLEKLLERDVFIYPVTENGTLAETAESFPLSGESDPNTCLIREERSVAEWVFKNDERAGATTNTLPDAKCLYMAVRGADRVLAVVGIFIDKKPAPGAFEKNLMVAVLDECALALGKEAMGRAKQKIEETARQEAMRVNLLRTISHDLRTPLTSISGNAGILLENASILDDEKKRTLCASIYEDAMWLINLVENLLSITRIENGSMHLHMEPELLEDVFREALSHLDRNAAKHHISVDLQDDLLMAEMDANLIVQVIINIVNNAVKYTQEDSHIMLSASLQQDFVCVKISDDGPGIIDSAKEKLFDMFYTADNVRGDGRRGLGLGLSLCKSIIAAHGGTISVKDNQPHGTIFYFTLRTSEVKPYE